MDRQPLPQAPENAFLQDAGPRDPLHEVDARSQRIATTLGPATERRRSPRRPTSRFLAAAASSLRVGLFTLVFYTVFFHLSVVRGSSMAPGIEDGDRILVEPWSYMLGGAERGDVVVMRYPLDPSVDYIKRIIGLPGDVIEMHGGYVWVNGELLNEPYVDDVDRGSFLTQVVEEDHYFVLGDNRPRSSDSREFGLVRQDFVRGRVDVRLWPLSRVGWVQ